MPPSALLLDASPEPKTGRNDPPEYKEFKLITEKLK